MLEPFEHWPVVLNPEGMVHSPKLHMLPWSPEMRDQDLTGEEVPSGDVSRERRGAVSEGNTVYMNNFFPENRRIETAISTHIKTKTR